MKKLIPPPRFKFKIDKFVTCIAMFAKENFGDFDKLKAAKLLYFADKYHLVRFGTPIIGDNYVHLDFGPVPSKALDILNDACENRTITYAEGESNKDKFTEYLVVKKTLWHFPSFALKKDPNLDCLSESEQEAVLSTIEQYGKYSPGELIDLTHQDASWLKTERNEEIDYRLFFDNEPDARSEALEYLESLSEEYALSFGIGFDD